MFSMFFGAGNVIFPLMIGQAIGAGNLAFALLGLIVTAVLIPFSGLMSITLFEGDYFKFFNRVGRVPGFFIILLVLSIIGPFGGIPRCIALTFSTFKLYYPGLKLFWFSLVSCGVIYVCSWKRNRIIDILGLFLTPVLLVFLLAIIVKALFFGGHPETTAVMSQSKAFMYGLGEGYNTMDLLAAFFFSSIICSRIKGGSADPKNVVRQSLKACGIGATLLALVYIGFSFAAAYYRGSLESIPPDQLLGGLGHVILGPSAGLVVSMTVMLSCLTTSIALTVVSSEFLQKRILKEKISYEWCLGLILLGSLLVSTLEFSGIVRVLYPILQVAYPALLVISFLNILHKLWGFNAVKIPFFLVVLGTLLKQTIL